VSTLLRNFVKICKVVQKFEEFTLGDLASPVYFIKNRNMINKGTSFSVVMWHVFWRSVPLWSLPQSVLAYYSSGLVT